MSKKRNELIERIRKVADRIEAGELAPFERQALAKELYSLAVDVGAMK